MVVLLREWFQHPNGALPAYEWNFDDVNPPVHVLGAMRVFAIDGGRDLKFLERIFQKLLINFTWWLNREDADGNNVFSGGFLGLDNISPIDRSNLPEGMSLEQADGTAWMAYYALWMLIMALFLASEDDIYLDMVVKFAEQFEAVAQALERQGLYDADDAFFYDRLVYPSGETAQVKVQTISSLLPLLPAAALPMRHVQPVLALGKRFARMREAYRETGGQAFGRARTLGDEDAVLVSVIEPEELRRTLKEFFDEDGFLTITDANGNLTDLSGNTMQEPFSHTPGFPGFSPTASQSLAAVADMQEAGVPVTYAYISDVHDKKSGQTGCTSPGNALGPGDACAVSSLHAYDVAFGQFFQRLADDGITPANTEFVIGAEENDQFAGANVVGRATAPTPCGRP